MSSYVERQSAASRQQSVKGQLQQNISLSTTISSPILRHSLLIFHLTHSQTTKDSLVGPPLIDPYPLQADAGLVNVSRREDSVHHLTMIRMQPRWVQVEPAHSTVATHLRMQLKNATHGFLGSCMQETPINRGIMSSLQLYCMCHHQRIYQYVFHFNVGIQTERIYNIKRLKN